MLAFPHILRYIALKISGLCIADRIFDFCRHSARLMYLQITKRFVILNAKRERIRIPLERETDCRSRLRGFAMTRETEDRLPPQGFKAAYSSSTAADSANEYIIFCFTGFKNIFSQAAAYIASCSP